MAKEPELMISVDNGEFPTGTRLLENDPAVIAHPRLWVKFADGHRAIFRRRLELQHEAEARMETDRAAAREAAIKIGARALASDSAVAESTKRAVRMSDGALELVYDEQGVITGCRPTEKELQRRADYLKRQAEPVAIQPDGYGAD